MRKKNSLKRKESLAGYLFIAPLMIGLGVFYLMAFLRNMRDSFTNKSSFGTPDFIGLENYIRLLKDPKFYEAAGNTLLYVIICVPVVVCLAVIIAVLLNSKIKGKGIYRTLIFIPAVTLPAAIGLLWKWLMNFEFGIINAGLDKLGIAKIAWLSDSEVVLIAISIVFIWASVSYQMIILLAGLQGIDRSYYEAAEMDGASPVKQFFYITLPLLSASIFFVTVTTIINVFQIFDFIYLMIPQSSSGTSASRSLVTYFFEEAFIKFDKGYGAAISMMLFLLILLVTVIQLKAQKKWVYYD